MLARILWGVHPQAKLTRRNLKEQARGKLRLGLKEFEKYLLSINELQRTAWELLLGRCKET